MGFFDRFKGTTPGPKSRWPPIDVATLRLRLGDRLPIEVADLEAEYRRLTHALEVVPNQPEALAGMAAVLLLQGEVANSLNIWNNVIYHAKDAGVVSRAYLTKGIVLDLRMHRLDKALQHYQRCRQFYPSWAPAILWQAEAALRADRAGEARQLLAEADAPLSEVEALAKAFLMSGNHAAGFEALQMAHHLDLVTAIAVSR